MADNVYRGVGGSKGSTSWTGKSELDDYISFAGLLVHYLQSWHPRQTPFPTRAPSDTHLTPVPSNDLPYHLSIPPPTTSQSQQPIDLLLAGYSYGSLITTHLPPTAQLIQRFANPQPGSAQAEILGRAHSLASQTLKDAQLHHEVRRGRPPVSLAYAMGGEEGEPGSRRLSRDGGSRKSLDSVRKSIDHGRRSIDRSRRRLLKRQSSTAGSEEVPEVNPEAVQQTPPMTPGGQVQDLTISTSYLLVSPLLPPIASLATMHMSSLFKHNHNQPATETKLLENPTFVIYGSGDFFTSAKKLRKWCASLQGSGDGVGGTFAWREVEGAGHFWREEGVEETLRKRLGMWLERSVIGDGEVRGKAKGNEPG